MPSRQKAPGSLRVRRERCIASLDMSRTTAAAALAALLLAPPHFASAQAELVNPYEGDPAAIRAGRALFQNECATCHNADATGLNGPDLTQLWARGISDGRVFESIREGVPGSVMPSSEASDQEIWAMVAWLESVSTVSPFENVEGDAERGAEIFAETCSRCHRVEGVGGSLGPDLTRITRVRSRDALERAIRNPGASVASGYWPVTLVTEEGARVRGLVKGEDAFSIQVLDVDQRLQGYLKRELVDLIREEGSLMPPFGTDRLTDSQLDDVVAYLASLRGTP